MKSTNRSKLSLIRHVAEHRPLVSWARSRHADLVMRMPFPDVAQAFLACDQRAKSANSMKILDVLMERRGCTLAILAGANKQLDDLSRINFLRFRYASKTARACGFHHSRPRKHEQQT